MSDEEKRERLLKMVLPSLLVGVIYFVFVADTISKKTVEAEKGWRALKSKGISSAALPGVGRRKKSLDSKINQLKQERESLGGKMAEHTGFLDSPNYGNRVIDKLSYLLARNRLRVIDEGYAETKNSNTPSPSMPEMLYSVNQWLGNGSEKRTMTSWRVRFSGRYTDLHQALNQLAQERPAIIPYGLTMSEAEHSGDGTMVWSLMVWLPVDQPTVDDKNSKGDIL